MVWLNHNRQLRPAIHQHLVIRPRLRPRLYDAFGKHANRSPMSPANLASSQAACTCGFARRRRLNRVYADPDLVRAVSDALASTAIFIASKRCAGMFSAPLLRRHALGVIPVSCLNTRLKWGWSTIPQASAT